MIKCVNCEYGDPSFKYRRDRKTNEIALMPYKVTCGRPEYKGRKYDVKPKSECDSYMKRERSTTPEQGE